MFTVNMGCVASRKGQERALHGRLDVIYTVYEDSGGMDDGTLMVAVCNAVSR